MGFDDADTTVMDEQDPHSQCTAEIHRLEEQIKRSESQFFYDMAKWAAQRWENEVRHRPAQNYLRAGLNSAWKNLEGYCLERREEIDALTSKPKCNCIISPLNEHAKDCPAYGPTDEV